VLTFAEEVASGNGGSGKAADIVPFRLVVLMEKRVLFRTATVNGTCTHKQSRCDDAECGLELTTPGHHTWMTKHNRPGLAWPGRNVPFGAKRGKNLKF
jgi:hypothetical protein